MNFDVSLFGVLSDSFTQFPMGNVSNGVAQLLRKYDYLSRMIIHRDANVIHYIYARQIDTKRFIGFLVSINGSYITEPEKLFQIFDKEVETLTEKGIIIHFAKNGNITTSLKNLQDEKEEVQLAIDRLRSRIEGQLNCLRLPASDFSVAIDSTVVLNRGDNAKDIANASYRYGYVIILNDKDYNSIRFNSYANTLRELTTTNEGLTKQISKLTEENAKIKRQKKQFKIVFFLMLFLLGCGGWLISLNEDLTQTKGELVDANDSIFYKNGIIEDNNRSITSLTNELNYTKSELRIAKNTIENQKISLAYQGDTIRGLEYKLTKETEQYLSLEREFNSIFTSYPFVVIWSTSNNSSFTFRYIANRTQTISVVLRITENSGKNPMNIQHTLTIYKGSHEATINYGQQLDNQKLYLISLFYKDRIIAGRQW